MKAEVDQRVKKIERQFANTLGMVEVMNTSYADFSQTNHSFKVIRRYEHLGISWALLEEEQGSSLWVDESTLSDQQR